MYAASKDMVVSLRTPPTQPFGGPVCCQQASIPPIIKKMSDSQPIQQDEVTVSLTGDEPTTKTAEERIPEVSEVETKALVSSSQDDAVQEATTLDISQVNTSSTAPATIPEQQPASSIDHSFTQEETKPLHSENNASSSLINPPSSSGTVHNEPTNQTEQTPLSDSPAPSSVLQNDTSTIVNKEETSSSASSTPSHSSMRKKKEKRPPVILPKSTHENNIGLFKSFKNYFLALFHAAQAQRSEKKNHFSEAIESFGKALKYMLQTNNNAPDVSILYYNLAILWEKQYVKRITESIVTNNNTRETITNKQKLQTPGDKSSQRLQGQEKVEDMLPKEENQFSNTETTPNSDPSSMSRMHRPSIVKDFEMDDVSLQRRTTVSSGSSLPFMSQVSSEDIIAHLESDSELDAFIEQEQDSLGCKCADASEHLERKQMLKHIFTYHAKSLRLNPLSMESYNQLGSLFHRIGRYHHSIALFEKTLEIDPEYSEGYNSIGVCLYNMGQLEKATHYYNKALKHDLKNPVIFANLGEVLYERGRVEEAIKMFSRAFTLAPNMGSLYCYFGLYYFEQEKSKEKAAKMFEKALELSPSSGDVHFYYGRFLLETDTLDKALEHLEKASTLVPPNRQMFYFKGLACEKKGNFKEACTYLQRAVEMAPNLEHYEAALKRVQDK